MIVDYKTDAVPAAALPSRVEYYRPQTGGLRRRGRRPQSASRCVRCVLLFLSPTDSSAEPVPDLAGAVDRIRTTLLTG